MNCKNYCNSCGICSRCGNCCTAMLPLTRKEEKKIKKYIKENNIEPEFFESSKDLNLNCCFYDRTNKICKIYEVRPSICKSFKCNRNEKTLIKERNSNQEKSYWNQMKNNKIFNLTDMRLLFYDDPRSLIANIIYGITNGAMECTKEQLKWAKGYLKESGQAKLADCIEGE